MQKTLENLTKAFIGESQARNRYTFYAKQAKKDGYPELEKIFLETADNEREHAKWLFRMIQNLKKDASLDDDAIVVEAEAPLTSAITASAARHKSTGFSSIWHPRIPPHTTISGRASALESITAGYFLFIPRAVQPPRTYPVTVVISFTGSMERALAPTARAAFFKESSAPMGITHT